MTDLFLSYKAEDRARVAPLVQALETDGLSVWWDEHIGGGDEWRDTILRHLEAARAVIVVWSRRSVGPNGQFVRDEATRALKRGTYLPVRIDKVDPPLGFGETQALDLQGWKGDRGDPRYSSVLATLRKRLGIRADDKTPRPTGSAGVPRRFVIIGSGAVLTAAAAGGVAWFVARPSAGRGDSIAVLPFANLSGDPAQGYFADGIAEELRSALSRISGLRVVARTSSEAVREEDAKAAAGELHVRNILSGSVRRSVGMLRINAQLIDGRDGTERWSETYDRSAGDALQIQTDIANKVAQALSLRLGRADKERIAQGGTTNADAQDLLLKADAYVAQNSGREAWERGIGMLNAALALDPHYGDALANKAMMQKVLAGAWASTAQQSRAEYREAEATARRAVAVAPQSARAYSVLGDILYEQLHPSAALVQYQKMMALNVEDVAAFRGYAVFLGENKRFEEALAVINRAISLDPLNPYNYSWKAYILAGARRYPEAIDSMRQVVKLSPQRTQPLARIGSYLMYLGRYEEAAKAIQAGAENSSIQQVYRAVLASRTGNRREAERILADLQQSDAANFQAAEVLTELGRKDEAIAALEKAWQTRDSGLTTILVDPLLDPLRGDPRFQEIVKRIGFPS